MDFGWLLETWSEGWWVIIPIFIGSWLFLMFDHLYVFWWKGYPINESRFKSHADAAVGNFIIMAAAFCLIMVVLVIGTLVLTLLSDNNEWLMLPGWLLSLSIALVWLPACVQSLH